MMNAASPSTTPISSNTTHMAKLVLLFWLCLLAACAPLKQAPEGQTGARYEEASFASLPGWGRDELGSSLRVFVRSCSARGVSAPLASVCAEAASVAASDPATVRLFFERTFVPYRILSGGRDQGMITGYYEPVIAGSRVRTERFSSPLYGVPSDLLVVDMASVYPELRDMRLRGRIERGRVVPYYARADIEARAGTLPAPVIAWSDDPVEVFFLQIQGSGHVQLEDGARIRIGFAEQNGHPYRSLGRYLVDTGELKLEQASMDGIKSWAAANPAKLKNALEHNASYVFFRELPPQDGPIGALGVPLTAGLSMAVDRRYIPLGAPVFMRTRDPLSEEPLERLLVAQDTGGAIRGAVRADLFWGQGAEAGARAGRMRQQGNLWLLWPKGAPLPALSP